MLMPDRQANVTEGSVLNQWLLYTDTNRQVGTDIPTIVTAGVSTHSRLVLNIGEDPMVLLSNQRVRDN